MHILIDSYGIGLEIENYRLCLRRGDTVKYIVPSQADAIHILSPCALTSSVISWAAENDISVLVYDRKGRVAARLWKPQFGSHAAIRIQQLRFAQSAQGRLWIKNLIVSKATSQVNTLSALPVPLQHAAIKGKLAHYLDMLKTDTGINIAWLRNVEAAISRWYWTGIASALQHHLMLLPRTMRPAKDRFNAVLNYLYGTLYGIVEGSLLAAGLDPHIAIMHRNEYNTPSFAFDVIEPFRHWADEFLIGLVLAGQLQEEHLVQSAAGILLTQKGKRFILTNWFGYLQQKTPSPKKLIRRKDQVQQLCTELASQLLQEYKAQNKNGTL